MSAPEPPDAPGPAADDVPARLARLASRGVRIAVGGDGATLVVDAPAGDGALSAEEWELLAAVKPLLLAHLAPPTPPRPSEPRFGVGGMVVAVYGGLSTPPREVAGVAYEPQRGAWRNRLAGEPFSRAESELRPAPPEGTPSRAPGDPEHEAEHEERSADR